MKKILFSVMIIVVSGAASFAQSPVSSGTQYAALRTTPPAGNEVFNDLMQGNKRFVTNKMKHPNQDTMYVHKLSASQHPKAIVLTCSDSRVIPEILFDQGLGDLFVMRNAGNVVDDDVLGSIEYAIEHLGVKTLIVLGHENCGAVTATVNHLETNNHIMVIEKSIAPAYELAEKEQGDKIHNTVVQNVALSISRIKEDKSLIPANQHLNDLHIYGAVYDLATGVVKPVIR